MPVPTLHLIDGHSLTFKAYFAIRGLSNPLGEPTGAVFGFLRMLLKFLDDYQPEALAVVFDTGKPTFRKELYEAYKANRDAPPEDFSVQMGWIHELLRAMEITVLAIDGFEADDVIATMAEQHKQRGGKTVLLSADKDLLQLVDDQVTMLRPGTNEVVQYDPPAVLGKLGVRPEQIADWLALVGDASDNIPGVPGIGEKSATALLSQFGSLEQLLARASEITKPRQREALLQNADRARLARQLATVKRDVPCTWDIETCCLRASLWTSSAITLMQQLGFTSVLRERGINTAGLPTPPPRVKPAHGAAAQDGDQLMLFPAEAPVRAAEYKALCDEDSLRAWVAEASRAEWLALDTETTSTNAVQCELVGISLAHVSGEAVYVPVGHQPEIAGCEQIPLDRLHELLKPLLDGSGPRLTAHHAKFDWKVLVCAGFSPAMPAFDTMIASYLLDPDKLSGHGLKALGRELCGVEMSPITDLIGSGARQLSMAQLSVEAVIDYASRDADVTLRLTEALRKRLTAEPELEKVNATIELPLTPALMHMELGGFRVDVEVLRVLGAELKQLLTGLAKQIWAEAGRPFNIGSTKQVAQILFEDLKLPTGRKGKTGFSTDESELERLSALHPVPRLILEYRGYEKLQSTYIDALPRLVNPRTGRIYTSFNQTIAATGRLSSTDPNLQNIPIRTEMGRAIRRAFVADQPGHCILKADYSQIELRILAHVTEDAALCAAYHEGRDIHRQTAAEIFGVAPDQVTSAQRAQAKTINFGIMYGMSAHGLAQQLGIGRGEAGAFIKRYFATYPGVQAWIDRLLERARLDGYVKTLWGRRRLVPDLTSRSGLARSNAERIAVNTPIQGTCADMIKLAMIRIDAGLAQVAPGGRMVCQVHDELVFSLPEEAMQPAAGFIREAMCNALPLNVPVEVDVAVGPNWAECRPL